MALQQLGLLCLLSILCDIYLAITHMSKFNSPLKWTNHTSYSYVLVMKTPKTYHKFELLIREDLRFQFLGEWYNSSGKHFHVFALHILSTP